MARLRSVVSAVFLGAAAYLTQSVLADADWRIAQAQLPSQTPAAPARPGDTQAPQQSPDVKGFADELQRFVEERRKRLDALDAEIRKGLETEQRANEIFDRLVASVKDLIERLGPQSEFRKQLDDLLARSRRNAEDNMKSPDPDIRAVAQTDTETATKVEKIINDANAEYARGLGTIRNLEGGRALAVARIKSRALQQATNAAEQYLGVVRSVIDDAEKFGKRTKETAPAF